MKTSLRKGKLHSIELIFKDYIPSPTNLVAKEATIEIGKEGVSTFSLKFVRGIDDSDYEAAEDSLDNLLFIKIWDNHVLKGTHNFIKHNIKSITSEFVIELGFRKLHKKQFSLTTISNELIFKTN